MKALSIGLFCVVVGASSHLTGQQPSNQKPPELAIEQIKKSVVFLQSNWTELQVQSVQHQFQTGPVIRSQIGTGFLIFEPDKRFNEDPEYKEERGFAWLITNNHMLRKKLPDGSMGDYASDVLVRVNLKVPLADGREWDTATIPVRNPWGELDWIVDTTDSTSDLAAYPLYLKEDSVDFLQIPTTIFATKDVFQKEHISENDDLLFAGLFSVNPGTKRNYPIVRHGRLALTAVQPVPVDPQHDNTMTADLFFADVMSFGGNSGSPVLLRVGGIREQPAGEPSRLSGYSYYLLGVMKGFISDPQMGQNSGIALVVPADKVLEMLRAPQAEAIRLRTLGYFFAEHGRYDMSESYLNKAVSAAAGLPDSHTYQSSAYAALAVLFAKSGRNKQAEQMRQKAVELSAPVPKTK